MCRLRTLCHSMGGGGATFFLTLASNPWDGGCGCYPVRFGYAPSPSWASSLRTCAILPLIPSSRTQRILSLEVVVNRRILLAALVILALLGARLSLNHNVR